MSNKGPDADIFPLFQQSHKVKRPQSLRITDEIHGSRPGGCSPILLLNNILLPLHRHMSRRVVRRVVGLSPETDHLAGSRSRPHPQDDVVVRIRRIRRARFVEGAEGLKIVVNECLAERAADLPAARVQQRKVSK